MKCQVQRDPVYSNTLQCVCLLSGTRSDTCLFPVAIASLRSLSLSFSFIPFLYSLSCVQCCLGIFCLHYVFSGQFLGQCLLISAGKHAFSTGLWTEQCWFGQGSEPRESCVRLLFTPQECVPLTSLCLVLSEPKFNAVYKVFVLSCFQISKMYYYTSGVIIKFKVSQVVQSIEYKMWRLNLVFCLVSFHLGTYKYYQGRSKYKNTLNCF